MSSPLKVFALTGLLVLAACGFSPMYGSGSSVSAPEELNKVEIAIIPDAEGVHLRNALIDSFYHDGYPSNPTYVLQMDKIREKISDLDITINSEATRKQIRLHTTLTLKNKETSEVVLSRELTALTSYNVLGSQFTTRVSESDAREAALNDLARQAETQVALYFKR